jgi:predicted DNA-binding transcriptional regulator AlpA
MAEQTEGHTGEQKPVLWLKDLRQRWDVSDVTIWRMRCENEIPPPTMRVRKKVGWAVQVIEMLEKGWAARLIAEYEASKLNGSDAQRQEEPQRAGQVGKSRKRITQPNSVPTRQ